MTPPAGALSFLETRRRFAPHFFEAPKQRCLNKLRRRGMKKPPGAASTCTLIVRQTDDSNYDATRKECKAP
jgi:hypothetical protein